MQWLCEICGYVHDGEEPPNNCPLCGAPRSRFSPYRVELEDRDDDANESD